jgi:multimeric flavodoxin WrbA
MNRILGVAGSPRPGGNTEMLIARLLAAAGREGAETRLYSLGGKKIAPCVDCRGCTDRQPYCTQMDAMQELYEHMLWADAIVFGTPVYMGTMSAQLKAVFDRCRPLWRMGNALSSKVASALAVGEGRWGGQELAIQNVYWAALNHGMVIVGGASIPYGNWEACGVAGEPGAILADREAIEAAEGLGRRLAGIRIELR